jgi:serine/threonine protein kinase
MVMGSPPYMSPEQLKGEEVNFRTDIYSFGVCLYYLCTGRLP